MHSFKGAPGDCTPPRCKCDITRADRGWFERFHKYCKYLKDLKNPDSNDVLGCVSGSNAFELIMTFAVVCGTLWLAAGGLSFWAFRNTTKQWASIPASIYIVSYMIFIGLFGVIMLRINERNREFNDECNDVKKKYRRSGNEFMAYSICGFVLIGASIICTVISIFFAEDKRTEPRTEP